MAWLGSCVLIVLYEHVSVCPGLPALECSACAYEVPTPPVHLAGGVVEGSGHSWVSQHEGPELSCLLCAVGITVLFLPIKQGDRGGRVVIAMRVLQRIRESHTNQEAFSSLSVGLSLSLSHSQEGFITL